MRAGFLCLAFLLVFSAARADSSDQGGGANFIGVLNYVNLMMTKGSDHVGLCSLADVMNLPEVKNLYRPHALDPRLMPASKRDSDCTAYLDTNGELGPKGEKIRQLLLEQNGNDLKYPQFFQSTPFKDVAAVCPKFAGFTQAQKIHFWVWFWASLSLDESSCGADLVSQGVNGKAVGEFQMEASARLRSGAGRPPECFPKRGKIQDFDNNITCAMAILNNELSGGLTGHPKKLFGQVSYWYKLKKSSGTVWNMVTRYPECR